MNIMSKKKKYKFQVDLEVEELTAVPFVSAVLFCKVHLLDGGKFMDHSTREEVHDHMVKWNARMSFTAKMTAPCSTGVLDSCVCRVSVRKEAKGGRSYQKLGFADIDLAEFAGGVGQCRRYLLQGYDLRHRQDNSMLKVVLSTTLLSGDPCFRTLTPRSAHHLPGEAGDLASEASTPGEAGRAPPSDQARGDGAGIVTDLETTSEAGLPGHSRNSSSQSGYGSLASQPSHSRQSSGSELGHLRNASSGSAFSDYNSMERPATSERRKKEAAASCRFDATRVNPEDVINDLLQNTDLNSDHAEASSGLQLFVARDGSTTLS
ncbi:Protein FAM102B [Amphibalanus amphitrite]|uniref:Protein FAM102B n=1 Tax=Amphibalanus amphitrite TaxID=1232801 RepID=A0A6A4W3S7_AMPAM|nr:protein FAM102A-like [Amphibalanus amphitrite]KAF0296501.1 Protein FAM102B [Amphibalanus amphitrite]